MELTVTVFPLPTFLLLKRALFTKVTTSLVLISDELMVAEVALSPL